MHAIICFMKVNKYSVKIYIFVSVNVLQGSTAKFEVRGQSLRLITKFFRKFVPGALRIMQTNKKSLIRRMAVQNTDVSRHHRGPIFIILSIYFIYHISFLSSF